MWACMVISTITVTKILQIKACTLEQLLFVRIYFANLGLDIMNFVVSLSQSKSVISIDFD